MSGAGDYRNYSAGARGLARGMDLAAVPLRPLLQRVAPRGTASDPPRSILVVRLDHVGDVLMSTPALAALRRAFPSARIDVLAAGWGRAALDANPHVNRVREGLAPWYDPRQQGLPGPVDVLRVAASLRREGYDWGFDFRGDPRVLLFYLLPAARRRFGFSRLGLESLLTDTLPYDRRRSILDLCLDLVAAAGAPPGGGRRPVFPTDESSRLTVARVLGEHGLGPLERFAVLAPGANRSPARWHADRFAVVADGLQAAGTRVILVGRAEDAKVARSVAASARRPDVDLTSKTSLRELGALLDRAALLVTNDSGAAHVAAAVECPTVAVFGPTDPSLTFPYEDGRRFVSVAAPIDHPRPCFRPGCSSDHGFSRISAEEVLRAALRVLSEAAGETR